MKSLIAMALCATALTSAAPALAQVYERPGGGAGGPVQPGHGFRDQLDALDGRIQEGVRSGQLDRAEADRASRELGSIRGEMERMRTQNGGELTDIQRGRLQERLDNLSRSIHWMREHGAVEGGAVPAPRTVVPLPERGPAPGYGQQAQWSLDQREDWLQQRIDAGRADGSLTRREASRIQKGLNDVRNEQRRLMYRGHGRLRDSDREFLEQRLDHLRESVRWARQNDEHEAPWRR